MAKNQNENDVFDDLYGDTYNTKTKTKDDKFPLVTFLLLLFTIPPLALVVPVFKGNETSKLIFRIFWVAVIVFAVAIAIYAELKK